VSRYDLIVVGAGANGLAAATLMARRGRKVLVLERRAVAGGLAAGEEFHPGYRHVGLLHDSAGVRRWAADDLHLERHGLAWGEEAPVFAPQRAGEGAGILCWHSAERNAAEWPAEAAKDARGYAGYRSFLDRVGPVVRSLLDHPPPELLEPSVGDLLRLGRAAVRLRLLGERRMMELLRIGPMCLADWLGEWFESDLLKALLAAPALHGAWAGPWSPGTNANLLLAEVTRGRAVRGGPAALVASLSAAAEAAGVEVRTGAEVASVRLADGRVAGVTLADGESLEARRVAAACDPKSLFFRLLPPSVLGLRVEEAVGCYRARGTTAKVHLALSAYPRFACRPELEPAWVRIGEGMDALERAYDPVKYRQFAPAPMLEIHAPTVESSELAPAGHHVFSVLVHHAPYDLEGGWSDARRQALGDAVVDRIAAFAPAVREAIVAREVLTPADLEERYGLAGGHPLHGEPGLDQLLMRPAPRLTRYRTPIPGLWLCGGGSHPGGGVTLAPGALAARTMLG